MGVRTAAQYPSSPLVVLVLQHEVCKRTSDGVHSRDGIMTQGRHHLPDQWHIQYMRALYVVS